MSRLFIISILLTLAILATPTSTSPMQDWAYSVDYYSTIECEDPPLGSFDWQGDEAEQCVNVTPFPINQGGGLLPAGGEVNSLRFRTWSPNCTMMFLFYVLRDCVADVKVPWYESGDNNCYRTWRLTSWKPIKCLPEHHGQPESVKAMYDELYEQNEEPPSGHVP